MLQFGFGGDAGNPFLPHNHVPGAVAYTGTHDNATTLGWLRGLGRRELRRVRDHVGDPARSDPVSLVPKLVRVLQASVAAVAIVPMQDVLALGDEARMNVPGRAGGNWTWRVPRSTLRAGVAARLRALAESYGRSNDREGESRAAARRSR